MLETRVGSKNKKYVLYLARIGSMYLKSLAGCSENLDGELGGGGGAAIFSLNSALHVILWQQYSSSQTHYMQ